MRNGRGVRRKRPICRLPTADTDDGGDVDLIDTRSVVTSGFKAWSVWTTTSQMGKYVTVEPQRVGIDTERPCAIADRMRAMPLR